MRILTLKLESVVHVGHPAYRKDVEVRSCEKIRELHIEDALFAHNAFDQLDSQLEVTWLADLVEGTKQEVKIEDLDEAEAEILRDLEDHQETNAQKALKAKGLIQDFDQASYDRETTETMGLPIGTKTNSYEYRLVLQIEQLDENGRMLCTYGPEPVVLLTTDDADEAIDALHKHVEADS